MKKEIQDDGAIVVAEEVVKATLPVAADDIEVVVVELPDIPVPKVIKHFKDFLDRALENDKGSLLRIQYIVLFSVVRFKVVHKVWACRRHGSGWRFDGSTEHEILKCNDGETYSICMELGYANSSIVIENTYFTCDVALELDMPQKHKVNGIVRDTSGNTVSTGGCTNLEYSMSSNTLFLRKADEQQQIRMREKYQYFIIYH